MNIARAVVAAVPLFALGVASGAEAVDIWEPLRRDPFEFRSPPEDKVVDAGKLVQEAEDLLAKGDVAGAERLATRALEALRAQGIEDKEIQARLFAAFKRIGDLRAEVDVIEEFRKLDLRLSGVAWSESNPVALVNGELCVPGDVVEGAKIDGIRPGEVVFVFKGVGLRMSVQRPGIERVEGSREAGDAGERE